MIVKFTIGQMRSTATFLANTPTTSATSEREAVTTGGRNDVLSTLLTTRCRLRPRSGNRGLDLGLLNGTSSFEMICRFGATLNLGIKVNGKVDVDGTRYTIQTWDIVDNINHWYKFDLTTQSGS
jgi:hypothetical protein